MEATIGERERRRGREQGGVRATITDDIRETLADHVVSHGLPFREAGQSIHQDVNHYTVLTIIHCEMRICIQTYPLYHAAELTELHFVYFCTTVL